MSNRFLLIALSSIAIMIGWEPQQAWAELPASVMALNDGEYAFADYPDVFDNLGDGGITIEVWFYLIDIPLNWRENWVLVSKPGSYTIVVRGKDPFLPEIVDPVGTTYVEYMKHSDGGGGGSSTIGLPPEFSPLNRWIHTAYQLKGPGPVQSAIYFDSKTSGHGEGSSPMGRSPTPLFIGGGAGRGSLKGWIDEVRISSIWRYPVGGRIEIDPPERFLPDDHTIALWHFDEGPWSRSYADSSGNNYTLMVKRVLPDNVDRADKLATKWGSLKSDR